MFSKGHVFLAVILVALVAVSGCTGGTSKQTAVQKSSPFVGGSQGLAISFVPGAPPDTIVGGTSAESFGVSVQLENKGESRVDTSFVKITGINPTSFGKTTDGLQQGGPALEPVQKIGNKAVPGESGTVDFQDLKYTGPITTGRFDFNVVADVCYDYKTSSFITVCVTENLLKQTVGANSCKTSGPRAVANSGAPIQLVSADQIPSGPNKLGLQLKIKSIGSGKSVGYGCDPLVSANADKVQLDSVVLGEVAFSCGKGAGVAKEVTLVNGEATVFCTADVPKGTFEDVVQASMSYAYDQKASKKITVQAV